MNGFNETATAIALAKQILMDCEGMENITLPKPTLKIILMQFTKQWHGEQDKVRSDFKKAQV